MKKYQTSDKYLVSMSIAMFFFLASGIAALCLLNCAAAFFGISLALVLGCVCGAALLAYVITVIAIVAAKKKLSSYLELSAEIPVITILFIALSPVALIIKIVDTLCEKSAAKAK